MKSSLFNFSPATRDCRECNHLECAAMYTVFYKKVDGCIMRPIILYKTQMEAWHAACSYVSKSNVRCAWVICDEGVVDKAINLDYVI